MNQLTVNSRAWYNEFRNGATFATDTGVYSDYFKMLGLERGKFSTSITIKTNVTATSGNEFLFDDSGADATFTMALSNWAIEGFKIGDDVRIVRGGSDIDETITNISGNILTVSDSGIAAALTLSAGTYYDDIEIRNITVPTSLVFKFGLVPNVADPYAPMLSPNPYGSWLDGQVQAYTGNSIGAGVTTLTGAMTDGSEISESVDVSWIATTDDWIFTFEVNHILRVPLYKGDYLTNLINQNSPSAFTMPNSYRYICQYKFGTSSTDPNEYRVFNDNLFNGSYGWIGNNFTSGSGVYDLVSIAIEDPSANALTSLEATIVNSVTIQIEKTSGNFAASDKAIVYVMKLPAPSEYENQTDLWETTHVFDSLTNTDGSAPVDGDFIKQLVVDVNATPSLLDITFDVDYSTAQEGEIAEGDYYLIAVEVGDDSLSAALSDRKLVWCQVAQFTKDADITGLITGNDFGLYTSEKRVGVGLKTTNVDTWDNRLHQALVTFYLTKFADSSDCNIAGLDAQVVSRNSSTGESFILDTFRIPFKATNVVVAGTTYQVVNETGYRDFDIKEDAYANTFTVTSQKPGGFDSTQLWTIVFPFVIPWREWIFNSNVDTSFYNNAEPQNKLNYKTSNYSDSGNWDIYIRLLVSVKYQGVVTKYGIYSTECHVRDFDVDPDTFNWSATTKLYDPDNNEIDYLLQTQDTRIATTFSMATAGGLTYSRLVGEITIEEYESTGQNCRLNSMVDWWYAQNVLKPIDGEDYVKVTQDVPNNTITIECLVDYTLIDPAKSYTIMSHLQDTT